MISLSFSTRAAARGDVVLPACLVLPVELVAQLPEAVAAEPTVRLPEAAAAKPLPPLEERHVCLEEFHRAVASPDMIDVGGSNEVESVVEIGGDPRIN